MLRGRHFQNAYVTRDIEKAAAAFKARGDVAETHVFEVEVEVATPAGRGPIRNKLAFIWIDDLQIELIQPVSGLVDLYTDWLPADDGLRFHHICQRVDDWDALKREVAAQPLPIVQEGGHDQLKFLYLDARSTMGHYLEYTWMTPAMWARLGGR
jgi:hypothetical protein